MKQNLMFMLLLAVIMSLAGCGNSEIDTPSNSKTSGSKVVFLTTTGGITKSKVYMAAGDDIFTVSNSGTTLYGGSGNDVVTISAGVNSVTLDQNVDRVDLSEASTNYRFKQTGNKMNVYDSTSVTLIASVPVQGDVDGTVFGFSDGTASALLLNGIMKLGNATVSATTATVLTQIFETPTPSNAVTTAMVSGNWKLYFTLSGQDENVVGLHNFTQNNNTFVSTTICGNITASGLVNGNNVSIDFAGGDDKNDTSSVKVNGVINGDTINGSFDFGGGMIGTWKYVKTSNYACGGTNPYYEIYGAQAGDYKKTRAGHKLLGTSNSGNIFNTTGYSRFILYVPSSSSKILFDAIGLGTGWVDSQPGAEYAHYTSDMIPTGSSWEMSDSFIEGAPDGNTMENVPGIDAYYGFSTKGASTLTIYLKH